MAQGGDSSSHFRGSQAQPSLTFQQLLQRDGSKWSLISSEIMKKEDENRHRKMSVLAKVKEKAKKLKISLRRKKHGDTNESSCATPRSCGVDPTDKGEDDDEYFSARMNDSKRTPSSSKNLENLNARQSKDENASNTAKPHFKIHASLDPSVVATADANTKKQIAATTDVPKVHEFPQKISRFSGVVPTLEIGKSISDRSVKDGENMKGESQTQDKGVLSVKEYTMHKFESGEDERTLSKVNTQAISPRRDKVRVAVSSFLKNKESSDQVNSSNVDHNNSNLYFKWKLLPTSTNSNTNSGSKTNPIKQSYSLGSNASKACLNLNQTFKSTFASYQDHFLGSSSNNNTILNYSSSAKTNLGSSQCLAHLSSPTKTSSPPLGPVASADYETQAPTKTPVSSARNTRVPGRKATSVRRVPVSRPNQKRVPIHTETNVVNSVSCI